MSCEMIGACTLQVDCTTASLPNVNARVFTTSPYAGKSVPRQRLNVSLCLPPINHTDQFALPFRANGANKETV